ncbi:MAG: hypothetical protein ABEK36_03100 [Candidatus Aenigmatarchaeota archaeon]
MNLNFGMKDDMKNLFYNVMIAITDFTAGIEVMIILVVAVALVTIFGVAAYASALSYEACASTVNNIPLIGGLLEGACKRFAGVT